MTEAELLDDFEGKVKRYLSELDKSSLIGSFGPAANAYFDAAQNLGASLLLRMVVAYRSQQLTDSMQAERDALGLIRPVPADLPFCIRSTKKPRPGEEARLTRIGRSSRAAHWR